MKNRSKILMVILPVLACFAFLPGAQAICLDGCNTGFPFHTWQGDNALLLLGGSGNTAFGWRSLTTDITGSFNTAIGPSLILNDGSDNTAVGAAALLLNSLGSDNTAVGTDALVFNDQFGDNVAVENTAVGSFAMFNNVDGAFNTAVGFDAMRNSDFLNPGPTSGANSNNAVGAFALTGDPFVGSTGAGNDAVGLGTLFLNQTGAFNDAMGFEAMFFNTTGFDNVAIGQFALDFNTIGFFNTVVGSGSGGNIVAGIGNTYLGALVAGPTDEFGVIRINDSLAPTAGATLSPACFIGGIAGANTGFPLNAALVQIDVVSGQLGTIASSAQFKKDINPMDKTSEAIFSLKPVTFHYKTDPTNTPRFGLIAEEVVNVNPALVTMDKEGKPYTVQYDQINAMLLNEFLKEHKKVEDQQASISQLKSEMQTMVAQLKEQAAQIQKVSAQLEMQKPVPQVVVNKP
jgi:hypothetical protein